MPRDLITADTYSSRLAMLQQASALAQDDHREKALAAALDTAAEPAQREAHAKVREIEDQIDALKCAREVSEEHEQRAEDERLAAERMQRAQQVIADRDEARALAHKADQAWAHFLEALNEARSAARKCDSGLRSLVSGHPRERIVSDTLANQLEGALYLGKLREADLPGIDLYDDPVGAMHAFKGVTVEALIAARLGKGMNLAAADVPELRQAQNDGA